MENLKNRKDLPEQIRRAIDELEELKKDPNMQIEATRKDMFIRDYFQGINDSKREGVLEGKAIGLAEGLAEGLAKGERKNKLEIAIKLLIQGNSNEYISELTGLSNDEIDKL